jgi:hypothetical protein
MSRPSHSVRISHLGLNTYILIGLSQLPACVLSSIIHFQRKVHRFSLGPPIHVKIRLSDPFEQSALSVRSLCVWGCFDSSHDKSGLTRTDGNPVIWSVWTDHEVRSIIMCMGSHVPQSQTNLMQSDCQTDPTVRSLRVLKLVFLYILILVLCENRQELISLWHAEKLLYAAFNLCCISVFFISLFYLFKNSNGTSPFYKIIQVQMNPNNLIFTQLYWGQSKMAPH